MGRLTYRLTDQCDHPTDSIILKPYMRYEEPETRKKILNRLAAYEDTGLEPEEIKEHEEAKYNAGYYHGDEDRCRWIEKELGPIEHLRDLIRADQDGRLHVTPAYVWHNGDSGLHEVPYKPWMGKWIATGTKFWLTREEAEAALSGKGISE